MPAYPLWTFYPTNQAPPPWTTELIAAVAKQQSSISTVDSATGLSSNDVLEKIAADMVLLGYEVESGKTRAGKIFRPVLFGEGGTPTVQYEVDAVHDQLGVVVEVEAGRGARGNAEYRDLVRTSLIHNARFLALLLPVAYRFKSGASVGTEHAYKNTRLLLDAVYASRRLEFPFEGILLIGY